MLLYVLCEYKKIAYKIKHHNGSVKFNFYQCGKQEHWSEGIGAVRFQVATWGPLAGAMYGTVHLCGGYVMLHQSSPKISLLLWAGCVRPSRQASHTACLASVTSRDVEYSSRYSFLYWLHWWRLPAGFFIEKEYSAELGCRKKIALSQ